jgi:hypothetical protein
LDKAWQAGAATPRRRKPGESVGAGGPKDLVDDAKPVMIRLNPELWARFRAQALAEGLSAKAAADAAMRQWLGERGVSI